MANNYIIVDQIKTLLQRLKGILDTKALNSDLEQHVEATNPHNITKTTIGLENVDNTSDLNKPISTATQSALDGKVDIHNDDRLMTAAEGNKLESIAEGAQSNTIESISLNGNPISPDLNKNVNLEIEGGKQEVFVFESEDNFPAQGEIDTLYISQASGKSYIWEIVSNEYTFSGSYCIIDNAGGAEAPVTMEATITNWYYQTAPAGTWIGFQNNSYSGTNPPYIGVAFDAIMAKIGKTAPLAGDKVTFYKYNGTTSITYSSEGVDYDISDCYYTASGVPYDHDLYIVADTNQQFSGIMGGPGSATYRGYQNNIGYKIISGEIVQPDWDQNDNHAKDYIKNKPFLGTAANKNTIDVIDDSTNLVQSDAIKTETDAIKESISNLSTSTTKALSLKADKTELESKADKTELDSKADKTELDSKADLVDNKIKDDQIPDSAKTVLRYEDFAHFPTIGKIGYIYTTLSTGETYIYKEDVGYEIFRLDDVTGFSTLHVDNTGKARAPITIEFVFKTPGPTSEGAIGDNDTVFIWNHDIPGQSGSNLYHFSVKLKLCMEKIGKEKPNINDKIIFYKYNNELICNYYSLENNEYKEYDVISCMNINPADKELFIEADSINYFAATRTTTLLQNYGWEVEVRRRITEDTSQYKKIGVQADWAQTDPTTDDYIKNKPNFATVAITGNYSDLNNPPTLGTAAEKDSTNQITAGSTALPEAGAVKTYVDNSIPSVTSKADKVQNATAGRLAGLDASGNLTDSGINTTDIQSIETIVDNLSDSYLERVDSLPANPSNGDMVILNEDGHVYKYVSSGSGETLYAWTIDNPGDWSDGVIIYTKLEEPTYEDMEVYKSDSTQYSYLTDDPSYTCDGYQEGYNCISVEIRDEATGNTEERSANRTPSEDITPSAGEWVEISSNVQPDWNQNDPTADDYIKNKPASGNGLPIVTEMPENPTDGQLVVWGGDADYTEGHTYKYDENKEEWVDIIENYIYDADWTSQGDISFNGRQTFHGHTTFTSNTGTTEFEGDVSFDPIYGTSEGSIYINTPIIINNSVNPSSNYWAIDESGNATFSSINVGTIYATNITMENYNGQIDMYGNDIIGVGNITGDAGNSIGLDASVVISGNLSVSNDLDISGDLSVSGTITDGSGNSLVYDNDSRLSDAREPLSHEHTINDITDFPIYGTTSGTICEGNDSRLSDNRFPTNDNNLVHKTGNESISGNKTFSQNVNITGELSTNTATVQNLKANNYNGYAEYLKALNSSNIEPYRFVTINKDTGYLQYTQADEGIIIGVTTPNALITGPNQSVTSGEKNVLVGLLGSFWVTINPDLSSDSLKPGDYICSGDSGTVDGPSTTTDQMRNDIFRVLKVDVENRRCLVLLK